MAHVSLLTAGEVIAGSPAAQPPIALTGTSLISTPFRRHSNRP